MKIAIITFSDFNTNYGSMLQAFSLKNYLESIGNSVEFIRYREFNTDLNDGVPITVRMKNSIKKEALQIYAWLKKGDIEKTKYNFGQFVEKYLPHTELLTSSEEMKRKLKRYDCYICGSDQIWNFSCLGGFRKPYFLDFAPENALKISYAASMGEYVIDEKYKEEVSILLDRLDYISVREKESVDQISKLTKKEVVDVVDPVFLTSEKEWSKMIPNIDTNGEYGICYFVRRSKLGKRLIKEALKYYKIPIYNLSDNMIYINGTSTKYISAGPLEFVALIKNAKFAIGSSFHLAAIATIFNTPVLIAGMSSNRSRVCDLFSIVDNIDNYITEDIQIEDCIKRIADQNIVKSKLNEKIVLSKEYLDNALMTEKK
ncbi:polysaccharide pyruvyl transferase family protein [Dorea formicigenerans]|uniref:polysaccharide pyruvyl transferase family protein n=1 Tax=Dorea formicigenerans TaxID=39486 RepID=UPI0015703383|nr:polysaccharide pyruvyl transferase family protein [Dorea formicigenerans]